MYERLKRLYNEGRLTKEGLENAVARGWITEEQMQEIIGGTDDNQQTAEE